MLAYCTQKYGFLSWDAVSLSVSHITQLISFQSSVMETILSLPVTHLRFSQETELTSCSWGENIPVMKLLFTWSVEHYRLGEKIFIKQTPAFLQFIHSFSFLFACNVYQLNKQYNQMSSWCLDLLRHARPDKKLYDWATAITHCPINAGGAYKWSCFFSSQFLST